jgi:hypothetical protein
MASAKDEELKMRIEQDEQWAKMINRKWQGLSDDELDALNGSPMALEYSGLYKFARAIEQALKEKNNGN